MSRGERLRRMLQPRSAVFIGGTVIVEAVEYCRQMGFAGPIHVVNPFHDTLAGVPCCATIEDLPAVPDIAYVGTPRAVVCETLAALSRAGVAGAVCNSAGFSELQGEGVGLQDEFVAAAGAMPVLGPNCLGFANFVDHAAFMQGFSGDHRSVERGVAVISNGGAYVSDVGCADRSLPIAFQAGVGNQAMVTMAELMDLVLDDDRVQAVNLYIEGLRDVARLSACALKAARRGIPVVAVKGGRHGAGQRATQTHTASLAGDDAVASALMRRLGFIETANAVTAIETLKFLLFAGVPSGRRTALATSSGSYAVLGSDAAEREGLVIPDLGDPARAALTGLLPPYILPSNPLDISNGQYFERERLEAIFDAYFEQGFDLALLVMCFPPPGGWDPTSWHRTAAAYARQARRRGLPCAFVSTLPEALPDDARAAMIDNHMAPLMGIDDGTRAVAAAVEYGALARALAERGEQEIVLADCPPLVGRQRFSPDEAVAKHWLRRAGVPVPRTAVVHDDDLGPAQGLVYPIAIKALSPGLLHKSEAGAVVLNVANAEEVPGQIEAIRARLRDTQPGDAPTGFLLEEMVTDPVGELLVGVRRVTGIGTVATLAIGGGTVELLRDSATVVLPASRATIAAALRSLRMFPLLEGWRGAPRGDLDATLDAVEGICEFAVRNRDELLELEINPLLIRPEGLGVVAVDAVMRLDGPPETLQTAADSTTDEGERHDRATRV